MFEPKHKGIRRPLDNRKDTGSIVNPPRVQEFTASGILSATKRSNMSIKKPGGARGR